MFKPFSLVTAENLDVAISAAKQGATVLAGGSDIFVMMHKGVEYPALVDISNLKELQGIQYDENKGLTIGALVTHTELEKNEYINKYYPAISDACRKVASTQVRNKGTIGGNICNASPAADTAGPLLLYDAIVHVQGEEGGRDIAIEDFFTGVKQTSLKTGEIVINVTLRPVSKREGSAYLKLMKRGALEIGIVSTGIRFCIDDQGKCIDARVSLSAVAPTPIRAKAAEIALLGKELNQEAIIQAAELAYEMASPRTWRNSEEWSKDMVREYVKRTAELAITRMEGGN